MRDIDARLLLSALLTSIAVYILSLMYCGCSEAAPQSDAGAPDAPERYYTPEASCDLLYLWGCDVPCPFEGTRCKPEEVQRCREAVDEGAGDCSIVRQETRGAICRGACDGAP